MPRKAWVLVEAVVSDVYPDQGLPGPQPPFPPRPPTGPVDPGYSPPWAQAPVDPGYSPPWARPQPPHAGWPTVPGWPGGSLPGGVEGFPHPAHPIYIPITPPPESGLEPTHPIYIPVYPDHTLPVPPGPVDPGYGIPEGGVNKPTNPIMKPGVPGWEENQKIALFAKVKAAYNFWTGNLPTDPNAPPTPTPV